MDFLERLAFGYTHRALSKLKRKMWNLEQTVKFDYLEIHLHFWGFRSIANSRQSLSCWKLTSSLTASSVGSSR